MPADTHLNFVMWLANLIHSYGYIVILVGTIIEGETALVLGGTAAHLGYLDLRWVILTAWAAALFSDQMYFLCGRYYGRSLLDSHPRWRFPVNRIQRLLERRRLPLMLGFRFLYGARVITPFVFGMSSVPGGLFLICNILGAILWATLVGTMGYAFGRGIQVVLGDIQHYEEMVMGLIIAVGIIAAGIYRWRSRRKRLSMNKDSNRLSS